MTDRPDTTDSSAQVHRPAGADGAAAPHEAGAAVQSTTAAAKSEDKGKAIAVYALYLASFVVGFTAIIGVVLAYVSKGEADPIVRSHYDNAINIFWKGLLYSIVSGLLTIVLIGFVMLLVVAVWFVVRCVKGIVKLNDGEAYPNPGSWGF